jgi:hypothetical protein
VAASLAVPIKRFQSRSGLFFGDGNDVEMKPEDQFFEQCMFCGRSTDSKYDTCFQKSCG